MSWRYRNPPTHETLLLYYDSQPSTFLRKFFTTKSAKQFVIFAIDNNLTHDNRFVTMLASAFYIKYSSPSTSYFERLIQNINDNANTNFPCDFHNNLYMCYPPYRSFCDGKNEKQLVTNDVPLEKPMLTTDFIVRNILSTYFFDDFDLWSICYHFDEFAYREFLTHENTKKMHNCVYGNEI